MNWIVLFDSQTLPISASKPWGGVDLDDFIGIYLQESRVIELMYFVTQITL